MTRFAILLLLLVGCAGPVSVEVYTDAGRGRGVVVPGGCVLTVAHVVPGETATVRTSLGTSSARVVQRIRAYPEDVLKLRLAAPEILPAPARFRRAQRGDSGGPVMDDDGCVVGLLSGRYGGKGLVLVELR